MVMIFLSEKSLINMDVISSRGTLFLCPLLFIAPSKFHCKKNTIKYNLEIFEVLFLIVAFSVHTFKLTVI